MPPINERASSAIGTVLVLYLHCLLQRVKASSRHVLGIQLVTVLTAWPRIFAFAQHITLISAFYGDFATAILVAAKEIRRVD